MTGGNPLPGCVQDRNTIPLRTPPPLHPSNRLSLPRNGGCGAVCLNPPTPLPLVHGGRKTPENSVARKPLLTQPFTPGVRVLSLLEYAYQLHLLSRWWGIETELLIWSGSVAALFTRSFFFLHFPSLPCVLAVCVRA